MHAACTQGEPGRGLDVDTRGCQFRPSPSGCETGTEREGFEPSIALRLYRFSRPTHSTTLPPLRRPPLHLTRSEKPRPDGIPPSPGSNSTGRFGWRLSFTPGPEAGFPDTGNRPRLGTPLAIHAAGLTPGPRGRRHGLSGVDRGRQPGRGGQPGRVPPDVRLRRAASPTAGRRGWTRPWRIRRTPSCATSTCRRWTGSPSPADCATPCPSAPADRGDGPARAGPSPPRRRGRVRPLLHQAVRPRRDWRPAVRVRRRGAGGRAARSRMVR